MNPGECYTAVLPILSNSNFFLAIFEYLISIGCVVSYKLGACKIIKHVPTTQAIANIHKNKRSNTIATYFQSSSTCNWKEMERMQIKLVRFYSFLSMLSDFFVEITQK